MTSPRRQSGFSIVTAIFLLVILSMLGAFMLTISNAMHVSSAQDIQGSRAFRAARTGLEWGVARICNGAGVPNPDFPVSTSCPTMPVTACPAAVTTCTSPPAGSDTCSSMTVDNFTVTVACTMKAYDEGTDAGGAVINRNIFWLESTASAGGAVGSLGYVERTVNAFVEF